MFRFFVGCFLFLSSCVRAIDVSQVKDVENLVPVAVIGSGPSGFGAGFVTASKGYHTVIFQADDLRGGLNYEKPVKNWLGSPMMPGVSIMANVEAQVVDAGAKLSNDPVVQVDFSTYPYVLVTRSGEKIHALTVVIATGTIPKPLLVPGANLPSVMYKASKKDPKISGKKIVVVGSGEDAVSKAIDLAAVCKEVLLLVRGTEIKAADAKVSQLKKENIKVLLSTPVTQVVEDGVQVLVDNEAQTISCDAVVVAIGGKGNSDLFRETVDCDQDDYILLKPFSQETNHFAVFAAGAVTESNFGHQAFISASDGMKAGFGVHELFKEQFPKEQQKSVAANFYIPQK